PRRGLGQEVDGDQVHEVHQEDPAEHREGDGRHDVVLAREGTTHAVIDELDDPLDKVLQAAWNPGGGLLGGGTEDKEENQAENDGPAQGVDVNGPEAHFLRLFGGMGETPVAVGKAAVCEVCQVMLNVP